MYAKEDIQEPVDPSMNMDSRNYPWCFVETADGQRGFVPKPITNPPLSDFRGMFGGPYGPYEDTRPGSRGYDRAVQNLNDKWNRFGMPGVGAFALWSNWRKGGHDVLPEIYSSRLPYGKFDIDLPWAHPEGKCRECDVWKPRQQFSRYQWSLRRYIVGNKNEWGNQGLCMECETRLHPTDHCTCTRDLEVWDLCSSCTKRATLDSTKAHQLALSFAAKAANIT